jgi:hypothetical protein
LNFENVRLDKKNIRLLIFFVRQNFQQSKYGFRARTSANETTTIEQTGPTNTGAHFNPGRGVEKTKIIMPLKLANKAEAAEIRVG